MTDFAALWKATAKKLASDIRELEAINSALRQAVRFHARKRDEASHAAGRHKSDAALYEAALSRAEETIERIDGEVKDFEQSDNDAIVAIEEILIDYDKQKGDRSE
ncbi:hypothetical protein [Microbacterium sp. XT11]|uniref:hypothetical protein n=1 Tax=Microbacterium sp. XT11 TaxID=367477 RepID=UPI00082E4885|nr:hypothetical protein [Microbacterium sp. XT11]